RPQPEQFTAPTSAATSVSHQRNEAIQPAGSAAPTTEPVLHFANYAEALAGFASREVAHNWQSPRDDQTIPKTQKDRAKYIIQLLAAFMNISACHDSDTVKSFQVRWANIANSQSAYTREQMETVCWKLLDIAIALHERGPVVLNIFDDAKLATVRKSRNFTFAERIQYICELLRLSKSRCETLLGWDDMDMTVAAPAQMISMAKTNKKQNVKRQEYLLKGRAKLKNQGEQAGDEE
ncbi:hypothetical protein EK21DRAFT_20542, partial [Setomelanomma holmii]